MIHTDFAELSDATLLRQRAEAIFHEYPEQAPVLAKGAQTPQKLRDLGVHQIELELQNEELHTLRLALEASRSRYLDLYDMAPVGYCTLDTHGLILRGNLKAAALLGLPRAALLQRPFSNFIFAEDRCQYTQLHDRLLATRQPQDCDLRMLDGNGLTFWTHLATTFAESEDGAAVLRVVVTDISCHKQAESELRRAASVFTHSGEGIMITSTDGKIIDVNEAFCRITGYSRQEVLEKPPELLKSGSQDDNFYRGLWDALAATGRWCGEVWNRRKSGEMYAALLNVSTVQDGQGNTLQYVALFSDITAIKDHQSHLEHLAHFDALTNLPNRLLLADRLQQAMAHARRRGQLLAVAYLDLDGFKDVNDRYGHDVGDHMLVHLATTMKDTLRVGDTLARIGGDEFVAVLVDLDGIESCGPMLKRLLESAAVPVAMGGIVLRCSISIGVTFFPQTDKMEAEQLLRQADQAMYQAKLLGKNCYQVFDSGHDSRPGARHQSLEGMREQIPLL